MIYIYDYIYIYIIYIYIYILPPTKDKSAREIKKVITKLMLQRKLLLLQK